MVGDTGIETVPVLALTGDDVVSEPSVGPQWDQGLRGSAGCAVGAVTGRGRRSECDDVWHRSYAGPGTATLRMRHLASTEVVVFSEFGAADPGWRPTQGYVVPAGCEVPVSGPTGCEVPVFGPAGCEVIPILTRTKSQVKRGTSR
jgi:hypothetical protein